MTSNPRDFRDWMKQIERQGVQLRGIPAIIQGSAEVVRDEAAKDLTRHPTAPIELTHQTAVYLDTSSWRRVRFLMDFPDVVFNTDGTAAAIQQYELWGREETPSVLEVTSSAVPSQALPGATFPGLASTESNEQIAAEAKPWQMSGTNVSSFFRVDGFIPGTVWRFRARAIGTTTVTPGEWSEEIVVQMLADTQPPPQPTAPTILVQRGTITVSWDGQSVSGAMPPDFKYAILAHGTDSSPTFEIARFGRGGGFKVVAGIDYYDPQFFRIAAVDESGNMGPWSEQGVGYTTPLVDADIILSTIDAAKTHLKNINAGVSILPNTIITEHLVVTEEMTAAIANFLYIKADKIDVNSLAADTIFTGLLDAVLVVADMFEGKAFTGGTFTGGRFQTDVEEYTGIKVDASGILAYSATGGNETFRLDAATGNLTANYGTLTGLKYQTHAAANTGIKIDAGTGIQSYNASNQLNFSISSSGAQFTGKVTSGFGAEKAILTDGVYQGRPGLQLVTGSTYYFQPFIVSYGASSSDMRYKGALFLSAAALGSTSMPAQLLMSEDGSFNLSGQSAYISSGSWGQYYIDMSSGGGVLHAGDTSAYIKSSGGATIQASDNNDCIMISDPYHYIQVQTSGSMVNGGLTVYGAKNFVMEHPTKPGMELLHGSTESPVSGVEYWGRGVIGADGSALVELPEYFEALTKPGNREPYVYGRGEVLDWTDISGGAFTVYGTPGVKFGWQVKAERYGGDFDVERVAAVRPDTGQIGPAEAFNSQLPA